MASRVARCQGNQRRKKAITTATMILKMDDFTSISDDLDAEDRNTLLAMSVAQTKQIEASIKAGKFLEAASGVQKLTDLSDIEFSIAIAGESGSGKSSFINAIRGLGEEDKDAAETGVMEVTKEPAQYWHPTYPMVLFWDLPGIDTPDFQPNTYLKEVNFRHYDVFIIIASERFRANHIKLAQELQRMGKKFYFVRSKVDLDLYNEKHKKSFNEERILEKIRNNCVSNLSRAGMSSPQVFLVSSREFQKYDSPKLQKTLLKELYSHKIRATEAPRDRGFSSRVHGLHSVPGSNTQASHDLSHKQLLAQEVQSLPWVGAMEKVPQNLRNMEFYPRYFLILKAEGGLRSILDLSQLNSCLKKLKFCMFSLSSIIIFLDPGE
ncbi:interferon-gamma-inducible GTPase 10-like [Emydura macquarii macquarii]|uniref:interferon-gamma-inducible GTPase 10-like n=1 Tax=Emydura macquarii macquarii TaxID=1129001 RepID=UPI00352AD916